MFYSSAAPGRHKIISKLSIMFNTILTWPLITIQYRYASLDTFYDYDFFEEKNHKNFHQSEGRWKFLFSV